MNKKIKIACVAIGLAVIGGIICFCSVRPQYDENGNMIEMSTYEESTYETTEITTSEETTYITTTSEETSETTTEHIETIHGHIVEDVEKLPTTPVDKFISYDKKILKINSTLEDVKKAFGEPIVLMTEEEFELKQAENTEDETESVNTIQEPIKEPLVDVNTYRYREFIIKTKIQNNTEIVKNIEIISEKVKNAGGFSPIGKEGFEITLSYGKPSYEDWVSYRYAIDKDSYLYFKLNKGKVSSWGIASDK